MKFSSATGITTFFLSALLGAAACGPDKDESPVEEAGEAIEEGAEEVGDEVDDAT